MKITTVGAGNMGRGIGTRAIAGGHDVEIIDRDPGQARALADELGDSATALDQGQSIGGDVVVFAVYYPAIKDAVREYSDMLAGKVVVDITNPSTPRRGTTSRHRPGRPPPRRWPRSFRREPPS
jgi:predicted dinucleotide-binding enzyme